MLAQLPELGCPVGERPFVVTDPGIVQAGLLGRLLDPLAASGARLAVYDQVVADPPEATVLDAAVRFQSEN